MNRFFLHPATCIQSYKHKYYVKNAMIGVVCEITDLKELNIENKELINSGIFVNDVDKEWASARMLEYLESILEKRAIDIGYIETTSVCPYTCVMCPKSTEKIVRNYVNMPMELYQKIIDQLPGGGQLTLHLFGDPLCDEHIYERIKYANKRNIRPSFSTNLISLNRLKKAYLTDIQLGSITVSMDAASAESMSAIRGKTNAKLFEQNLKYLEELAEITETKPFATCIFLQAISMKGNKEAVNYLKSLDKKYSNLVFFEKPFINFPGIETTLFKEETVFKNEEWIWLYDLLGKKKPYRCLKVWNPKEYGIMSDGRMVPCCMCYNETAEIGNLNIEALPEILSGKRFRDFRRRIFLSEECGNICDKCRENGEFKTHQNIPRYALGNLADYCIDEW